MVYDKKKDGEPVLEFFWDSLELAADKTYSTTFRIKLTGWWEGGRPRQVAVSVYQRGQEPPAGSAVRIQKGFGTFPLTGLLPGHHYLVVAYIGDRLPVQKMIVVPELPKPKTPEQEALELEQIQFKRRQVSFEHRKLVAQEKELTPDEKKTVALKAKTERVRAEKEYKEAESGVQLLQSKRKIEILGTDLRTGVLEVFLCRLGKDGRPEPGEICAIDGMRLAWTMESGEDLIVASLDFRDRPHKVTFFLPDDREVKVTVDVPAKPPERVIEAEVIKSSAGQRIAEAWQRGCRGELLAAKDPSRVLPLAAVASGVLATILAFRGPEGPGGK